MTIDFHSRSELYLFNVKSEQWTCNRNVRKLFMYGSNTNPALLYSSHLQRFLACAGFPPPLPPPQSLVRSVTRWEKSGPWDGLRAGSKSSIRAQRQNCNVAALISPARWSSPPPLMLDKQQTWAWPVASGQQHLIRKKFLLEHWTLLAAYAAAAPSVTPRSVNPARCLTPRLTHGHWTRARTPKLHSSSSSRQASPAHRSSQPLSELPSEGAKNYEEPRRPWDGGSWCVSCPSIGSSSPSAAVVHEFNKLWASATASLPLARLRKEEWESIQ